MNFAAAMSEHPDAAHATGEVIGSILERLGEAPDLVVAFLTAAHRDAAGEFATTVRHVLQPGTLIGATAQSIAGGDREVEDQPAIALWAARIGPVTPVRLTARASADGMEILGAEGLRTTGPDAPATLLLLTDPFSFPVTGFVDQLAESLPQLRVMGGVVSAAGAPGGNRLILDDAEFDDGAVGVVLDAQQPVTLVVSQGCRPIGSPWTVTQAEGNTIGELAGQPALVRLAQLAEHANTDERELLERGVHLGRVVDEHRAEFGRGDFLIRNLLGADADSGALVAGDEVPVGSTVQFQVRDADSADEDLRLLLSSAGTADAALLFTCNGRGMQFFGAPDHDAELIDGFVNDHALAGMFCAGEIGPIGGRSFLHGFTASIALFHGTDRHPRPERSLNVG